MKQYYFGCVELKVCCQFCKKTNKAKIDKPSDICKIHNLQCSSCNKSFSWFLRPHTFEPGCLPDDLDI